MADRIKRIGYNRKDVPTDIARVLDTLLANLPANTEKIDTLPTTATLSEVIVTINKIATKLNNNR